MSEGQGLRERKRQRTREQIIDAALALFDERGYDRTTVADIAAAADIAPRTFFAYFVTKEAVVFHDFDEVHASLARHLHGRAPGRTTFDAMRDWLGELVGGIDPDDPRERLQHRIVRTTPALRAHERALLGRCEETLREGIATDLGLPADHLRPTMVAAAATAALTAIEQLFAYEDDDDDAKTLMLAEPDLPLAVLDEALAFLRGGTEALRERPAPPLP